MDWAENGSEAVDQFEASDPGSYFAIFMDMQMPVMDGREATRRLRADPDPALRDLPIVAMTADAFAEDVVLSRNAGMNDHIAKPLDLNKLNDVLQQWL